MSSGVFRYAMPVFCVALSLAATYPLQPYGFRAVLLILCILVSAWVGGLGPGLWIHPDVSLATRGVLRDPGRECTAPIRQPGYSLLQPTHGPPADYVGS